MHEMMKTFRQSIAIFDGMIRKSEERESSPRRKIARPTLPPESYASNSNDSNEESYKSIESLNNNKAPQSDDEMNIVASGN